MSDINSTLSSKEWFLLGGVLAIAGVASGGLIWIFPEHKTLLTIGIIAGVLCFCVFSAISMHQAGGTV